MQHGEGWIWREVQPVETGVSPGEETTAHTVTTTTIYFSLYNTFSYFILKLIIYYMNSLNLTSEVSSLGLTSEKNNHVHTI